MQKPREILRQRSMATINGMHSRTHAWLQHNLLREAVWQSVVVLILLTVTHHCGRTDSKARAVSMAV